MPRVNDVFSLPARLIRWLTDNGELTAYAWPGGYQALYFDRHNEVLCPDCANKKLVEWRATLAAYNTAYDARETTPTGDGLNSAEDLAYAVEVRAYDVQLAYDDLPVVGDIYYEGSPEFCADCNAEIESAYGDPDEDEESDEL